MQTTCEHRALLVMGVCGVGKTSVSRHIALRLGASYIEADDYHPAENVTAMRDGVPLSDEMRKPWLTGLSTAVETVRKHGPVVVACSALKRNYRDLIRAHVHNTSFICLVGDRDLIAKRLQARKDHYMSPALLDSQIATLELPASDENSIVIDVAGTPEQVNDRVVKTILEKFST
ncbi:gluconokinase [Candidatus Halocynthiibacter alkanivorans]|uniref:gluconokinase n=1 Tax=Candidatus Halocynthiibacter alkanivorans TaxID=2267619 RepID=UPI000DF242F7|nr:gluconokinase [Candidatus Halocynthiibacter alkanivorans]